MGDSDARNMQSSCGVRHPQHTQTGSNSSTIAADNNKV